MNKNTAGAPGASTVNVDAIRDDVRKNGFISNFNDPMLSRVAGRFGGKISGKLFSKPVDHELAERFSYKKNGVEIVTIPMNRLGYCAVHGGDQMIFVKSELPRAARSLIIRWGLKQLAEGNMMPISEAVRQMADRPAARETTTTTVAIAA